MVTRLLIVYLLILFVSSQSTLLQSNIFAQQSTSDAVKVESKGKDISKVGSPRDKLLLDYVKLVSDEEEKHRTYLHRLYSSISIAVTVLVAVLVGVQTWFNIRSRKEIKETVDDTFQKEIKGKFENKLRELRKQVSDLEGLINISDSLCNALARVIIETSCNNNEQEPFDERKLTKKNILWVDDKKFNIHGYIYLLKSLGINVMLATTTAETIKHLGSDIHFHLIVSNMGRDGDGSGKTAGLDLLEKVGPNKIPIVIFTRPDNVAQYKDRAIKLYAYDVVSGISGILNAVVKILAR